MKVASKLTLLTALEWLVRVAVAGYFLLAAVEKLWDPLSFAKDITNYKLVMPVIGMDYVYPVAMLMPALELVSAIALLTPRWKKAGALACGGLLILFTALIVQAVARGLNIDCGCLGAGAVGKMLAEKVGWEKILENVAMLAGCVFVWFRASDAPLGRRYALVEKARVWR
jgi:putative oxidoreductase